MSLSCSVKKPKTIVLQEQKQALFSSFLMVSSEVLNYTVTVAQHESGYILVSDRI